MNREEYLEYMKDLVAKHGWAVQLVGASDEEPHFNYTVGLTPHGLPELIMFGLSPAIGHTIINDVAERLLNGDDTIKAGAVDSKVLVGYDVTYLDVMDTSDRLTVARALYGDRHRVTALQIIWPDKEHRFPWDEGFDVGGVIPLLGVPVA